MHKKISKFLALSLTISIIVAQIFTPFITAKAQGLDPEQQKLFNEGILYYDYNYANNNCSVVSTLASNKNVYVIGDSYAVGVQSTLTTTLKTKGYDTINFNTSVGRSINGGGSSNSSAIQAITTDANTIKAAGTIIVMLGTNPDSYTTAIPTFMKQLGGYNSNARTFWVNVGHHDPKHQSDMQSANTAISQYASTYNYTVVDWNKTLASNPALVPAGQLHPTAAGYQTLTDLIATAVGQPTVSAATSSSTGSSSNNEAIVWSYLLSKGLSPVQAAGLMGNMKAEAHFEPRLVEYGWLNSRGETSVAGQPSSLDDNVPPDQNSKGQPGYGIVQWTSPSRKQGLRDAATQKGVKAGDLMLQLDYLWSELNGSKSAVLSELKAATSVNDAADIILTKYEAPADIPGQKPVREKSAQDILKQFAGVSGDLTGCTSSAGVSGTGGWSLSGQNAMVYYSQFDAQWKDKPYGIGTIGVCGCGPTSMAMIAATLNGDKSIIPPTVAQYYADNGGQVGGGDCSSSWKWQILATKYGLKMQNIGTDYTKAAQTLQQGGLVLTSVNKGIFTNSGHILVLRQVSTDGNTFYVADPAGSSANDKRNTTGYTVDTLRSSDVTTGGNLVNMWSFTK